MPVDAKQSICVLCDDFRLIENTGIYGPTNLGGYGTPNEDFGDTTPYTAEFFPPAPATSSLYTLNLLASPPAPTADGYYVYNISRTLMGVEDLVSGVWNIKVALGGVVEDIAFLATGDIEKRIKKCICCSGIGNIGLRLDLLAVKEHFKCGNTDEAQKMMNQLYRDTKTCCGC